MLNHVTIQGRLVATPELKLTQAGIPCTNFTIANDTGAETQTGEKIVHFLDVVAWRKQAEFACKYLSKGRLVIVEGELATRKYVDRDGNTRKVVEINASRLHFSDSKPKSDAPQMDNFAEGYAPRQQTTPPPIPAPPPVPAPPPIPAPPAQPAPPPLSEPPADDDYPF